MWYYQNVGKGLIMHQQNHNGIATSSGNRFGWAYWQWALHLAAAAVVLSIVTN